MAWKCVTLSSSVMWHRSHRPYILKYSLLFPMFFKIYYFFYTDENCTSSYPIFVSVVVVNSYRKTGSVIFMQNHNSRYHDCDWYIHDWWTKCSFPQIKNGWNFFSNNVPLQIDKKVWYVWKLKYVTLMFGTPFAGWHGLTLIPAWISNYIIGTRLLIHSQTSTVQLLKFGNG